MVDLPRSGRTGAGWLDELLEILEDPLAALERRGLADEEHVEIPLD